MAASQSILASAKARQNDVVSMVGRRLVSEKEWQMMQEEARFAMMNPILHVILKYCMSVILAYAIYFTRSPEYNFA